MPLTRDEEIWAFNLGVAAEMFFHWDMLDNPPVSSEAPYKNTEDYAARLGVKLDPHNSAAQDKVGFVNRLAFKIEDSRPTLMDAFMFGRAANRLSIISLAIHQGLTYWEELWDNSAQAVLHGASRLQVPEQLVKDWMRSEGGSTQPIPH